MSLSKPSICKVEPQPSTSAAAAKQMETQVNKINAQENEKKRIQLRASMICSGCRCGWLCCDCNLGCLSCKQRSHFCYCQLAPTVVPGVLVRIPCLVCLNSNKSCTCNLAWRCKWCTVSLLKCKRGGCVKLLPDRRSPEAASFVEIFNREDDSGDEEVGIRKQSEPLKTSNYSWANKTSNGSSWSVESTSSAVSSAGSFTSVEEKSDV